MADRFLDGGVYSSAQFTASFSGGTMTVSSVASGTISLGQLISSAVLNAGAYVTGGPGLGGVGTYSVSTTQTLASGAVSGLQGMPLAIPFAWGIPQEGDGLAGPGGIGTASTASATVSVDLGAYTAAAGATFSVGGATLVCVASGASGAQFNAGAGTALATNIAAAINRTSNTAAVTSGNPAAGWPTPKIQDCFYAQAVGGALQIMTRAGSAVYNSNALWAVMSSGLTGGAQFNAQFSGGVSGCWGYLSNFMSSGAFPSVLSSYGLFGSLLSIAGSFSSGDTINVRANKTFQYGYSQPLTLTFAPNKGTVLLPVRIVIDDSTIWSDGPNPVLTIKHLGNNYSLGVGLADSSFLYIAAKQYSSGVRSLVFFCESNGSGGVSSSVGVAGNLPHVWENVEFTGSGAAGGAVTNGTNTNQSVYYGTFINCRLARPAQRASPFIASNGYTHRIEFIGGEFDCGAPTGIQSPIISASTSNGSFVIGLESVRFLNFQVGSVLLNPQTATGGISVVSLRNCDLGNVTGLGPTLSQFPASSTNLDYRIGMKSISIATQFGNRMFVNDTPMGFVEWNPGRSFPSRAATIYGTNPLVSWSLRFVPPSSAGVLSASNPFELPRIGKENTLDGSLARTLTLYFGLEESLTWSKKDLSISVSYMDDTGRVRIESSLTTTPVAFTPSTATWSNAVGNQFTFVDAGTLNFNKYELNLTTAYPVKAGTELGVTVKIHSIVANTSKMGFVCPELGMV